MREIKFRAWHSVNKVMYANKDISVLAKNIVDDNVWSYMQFTGLKDKNGVDIYEGDIVQWKYGEQGKDEFYLEKKIVSFYNGGFNNFSDWYSNDGKLNERLSHYRNEMQRYSIYERDYDIEVIGNKFESPELI